MLALGPAASSRVSGGLIGGLGSGVQPLSNQQQLKQVHWKKGSACICPCPFLFLVLVTIDADVRAAYKC